MTTPTTQREADERAKLPLIGHPEPRVMAWSALEENAIRAAQYEAFDAGYRAAIDQSTRQAAPNIIDALREARQFAKHNLVALAKIDAAIEALEAPAATDQPSAGQVDEREGMEGLRPYEFMVSGQSFRWYLKRDVDALLSARASLTPTAPPPHRPKATIGALAAARRFLGWKVPKDFSPDSGISFVPYPDPLLWPMGTNLLNEDQAKAMFEHCPKDVARPTDDDLWEQTMRDRDTNAEWADKLANAIAEHFGADIGEHSNMNCPWAEALEVIEGATPTAPQAASQQASGEMAHEELADLVKPGRLEDHVYGLSARVAAMAIRKAAPDEALMFQIKRLQSVLPEAHRDHIARAVAWHDAGREPVNVRPLVPSTSAPQAATTASPSCTCPSGDGSLRWPCPQHPPEAPTAGARFSGEKSNG